MQPPASVIALRSYSTRIFTSDLIAGVTVGLVALPLAMAFAISSGMTPQAGIYCAIVTGFLISALGGSYVQIGGPTGAFVVVVSGIIAEHGLDGLFMCTMMAGVVLVVMGLTGTWRFPRSNGRPARERWARLGPDRGGRHRRPDPHRDVEPPGSTRAGIHRRARRRHRRGHHRPIAARD